MHRKSMLKARRTFICIVLTVMLPVLLSLVKPKKLMRVKVKPNTVVLVPKGWHPMDEMDFRERYPSVRAPILAYTDEQRLVDFSVNLSATQWPDRDAAIAKEFFKSSIHNMFDKVDMISEGVREIRGKKFIYFEFESLVKGNKRELGQQDAILKYTYIQYLLQSDRAYVFSFNCPKRARQEWQETARKMMLGIRVGA